MVCQIASRSIRSHIVYDDEHIICFLDADPIAVGHVLICPKVHLADLVDLPINLVCRIFSLAKSVASAFAEVFESHGVSMIQNNGKFNELGHFHLHVFPRAVNDGFAWSRSREALGGHRNEDFVQRRLSSALRLSSGDRRD
ncbi:HIT domain-containing protein [Xanthomonas sp. 60]